jgi:hypothetical protein
MAKPGVEGGKYGRKVEGKTRTNAEVQVWRYLLWIFLGTTTPALQFAKWRTNNFDRFFLSVAKRGLQPVRSFSRYEASPYGSNTQDAIKIPLIK